MSYEVLNALQSRVFKGCKACLANLGGRVGKARFASHTGSLGETGKHGRLKICTFLVIGSSPIVSISAYKTHKEQTRGAKQTGTVLLCTHVFVLCVKQPLRAKHCYVPETALKGPIYRSQATF